MNGVKQNLKNTTEDRKIKFFLSFGIAVGWNLKEINVLLKDCETVWKNVLIFC